ncbi:ABC transporter permease [Paenibacillus albicereus]|uniref:ABC transporter permease n=1 Tax=Paenibacillus albicereus TaxID=2726185 RepID=A0A6H2GUR2_9BACL|nr:ABC transporter permease [Paenibacillus albicereus]QJC51150.1 ABC transporter permease [Paenibacillus albicereus]
MFDFAALVANENMKIYRRPRAWIMLGLLALLAAAIALIASASSSSPLEMWPMTSIMLLLLLPLANIFSVIIAADSVAGEFTGGTIKLLLIRPWTRSKVLLSKYVSVLLFVIFSLLVVYLSVLLINSAVFGYERGVAAEEAFGVLDPGLSAWSYYHQYFLLELISSIVGVTLAFMISAVFRSSALSIGLSLFLLLMGATLSQLLQLVDKAWVDYVLFQHLSLTRYIGSGGASGELHSGSPMTMGFSLSVLAGYYLVFMALSWFVFTKRDVAA